MFVCGDAVGGCRNRLELPLPKAGVGPALREGKEGLTRAQNVTVLLGSRMDLERGRAGLVDDRDWQPGVCGERRRLTPFKAGGTESEQRTRKRRMQ